MRHCCFFMGLVDKKILITFLLIVLLYQCYKLWPVVVTEWHQKKFDIFSFVSGFWFKFKAAFVALKPSIRALWFQSDPLPPSSQEADLLYNKLLMHLLHSAAPVFTRALSSSLFFFFFSSVLHFLPAEHQQFFFFFYCLDRYGQAIHWAACCFAT